jgi:hypothetical protein
MDGDKCVPMPLGKFDWQKIEAVFEINRDTVDFKFMLYLMNASGELQWRNLTLEAAPDAKPTIKFIGIDEKQKNAERQAWEDAAYKRLGIPPASELYKPNARLAGAHPRFMINDVGLAELKRRFAAPEYAEYRQDMIKYAKKYSNSLYWQAGGHYYDLTYAIDPVCTLVLTWMLTDDAALKAELRKGISSWITTANSHLLNLKTNLWPSATLSSMSILYDWAYNDLSADERTALRKYIIETARWTRSPKNSDSWFWRSLHQWTANHKVVQYSSLAQAAVALWGETEAPIEQSEPKMWLDEAMRVFYFVEKLAPESGAPMEGWMYRALEAPGFFNLLEINQTLVDSKINTKESPAIRLQRSHQLNFILPGNAGICTYADSYTDNWGIKHHGTYAYYQASTYNDPLAQRLGMILQNLKSPADYPSYLWRGLFWFNPNIKPVELKDLPLYFDDTNYGLFVARKSWTDPESTLFFTKIGPQGGQQLEKIRKSLNWEKDGINFSCGHWTPDVAAFQLYVGKTPIVSGVEYPGKKMTLDYPVAVFGAAKNSKDDQYTGHTGAQKAWYYYQSKDKLGDSPQLIRVSHDNNIHIYVAELGGMYNLPGGFPQYRRIMVYLPGADAVIVADKITTVNPQLIRFRIPLTVNALTLKEKVWSFSSGYVGRKIEPNRRIDGTITDISPENLTRKITEHKTDSKGGILERKSVEIQQWGQSAIFGIVLQLGSAPKDLTANVSDSGLELKYQGKTLSVNWNN